MDESPVGQVLEINGEVMVVRTDGSTEPLTIGSHIYQGDIIETSESGAVNIEFIDESTFAVSENARLAIDEYVFDPATESGSTNFSVLRGIFVFTSGLIGRDDPDDVQIDTPVGSIGIRGTTIMGNVDTGEITVIEGAIVLRNFDGSEMTLDEQFETGRFDPASGEIVAMGTLSGDDMSESYASVSGVMPALFSGFSGNGQQAAPAEPTTVASAEESNPVETEAPASAASEESEEVQTAAADTSAPTGEPPLDGEPQLQQPTGPDPFDVAQNTGFGPTGTAGAPLNQGPSNPNNIRPTGETAPGTGTGGGETVVVSPPPPPPLLPLDIEISRLFVEDSIPDGAIIAGLKTTSLFSDVKYTLLDDLGGQITLVDGAENKAVIRLVSGPLSVGPLDIQVRAELPDGRTVTEGFTINVVDQNTAPVISNGGAVFGVDEDESGGFIVGNVTASDVDVSDTLTYAITGGNVGGAFSIDASGNIILSGSIDYETLNSYTLTVRVTDDGFGTLSDTATFTVNLNDINDAPVLSALPSTNIAETILSGTIVLDVSTYANDVDAGDTLTYSITGGNGDGAFSINSSTGVISVVGGILDFDFLSTNYDLSIQVMDGSGMISAQNFRINVDDVDDEATSLDTNAGLSVDDGDTIVLDTSMLDASDVDTADGSITYTITTDPARGHIAFSSDSATPISSFTQQDLDSGDVIYVHDGTGTAADSFDFDVGDGTNGDTSGTFSITVTAPADITPPTLEHTETQISGISDLTDIGTNLHLKFDEDIQKGTGNIVIRRTSDNSMVETINVGNASVVIENGNTLHFEPTINLDSDEDYYVELDAGAIEDTSGNPFGGFSGPGTFDFSTGRGTFLTTVGGLSTDSAADTLELFEGGKSEGYLVVGSGARGGQTDITLTKMDHHGFVQDVTTLGDNTGNENVTGIAHNASGVFIAGTTNDGAIVAGGEDFMLVNLNGNGDVSWTRTYGTANNDISSDVTSFGSSNVAIAGTSYGTDNSALIIGVDGAGTMLWQSSLSETGLDITADAIISMNDAKYGGNLMVGGTSSANGGDMVITSLNSGSGAQSWSRSIDVSGSSETLSAMTELTGANAGDFILAGTTDFGGDPSQGLLVKVSTDVSGDNPVIDWAVQIGDAAVFETINDVIELSDGTIAVAGSVANGSEAFVAVFDSANGSLIWAKSLSYGASTTQAHSIEETDDGSLLISGTTNANTAGTTDAFVFQMAFDGEIQDTAGIFQSSGVLGDGWTLNDQSGISTGTLTVGGDIDINLNTVTRTNPGVTENTSWALDTGHGEGLDHANDILGDTNNGYQLLGDNTGNVLNAMGNDGAISSFNGADTITIDGYDIVHAGSGNDVIEIDFSGRFTADTTLTSNEIGHVDGGTGNDIFRLESDHNLNLRFADNNGLMNIERISLDEAFGYGQTVQLSYESIIAMTDDNDTLYIDADAGGDVVIADLTGHGFTLDSGGGSAGAAYEHYSNGTVNLYIADAADQTQVAI